MIHWDTDVEAWSHSAPEKVVAKASHQLVNQDSGITEWFTDPGIIEAARDVMGSIDLDPASSETANRIVKAKQFFTKDDDGLKQPWEADNLWLNHPFAKGEDACPQPYSLCRKKVCNDPLYEKYRGYHIDVAIPSNAEWITYYEFQFEKHFGQACNICFAATSEDWFQPLMKYPQCYLSPRTNYYRLEGDKLVKVKGVTKGSVVTYLGPNVVRFAEVFSKLGTVKVCYQP